jgi:hypothetical protein
MHVEWVKDVIPNKMHITEGDTGAVESLPFGEEHTHPRHSKLCAVLF